MSGDNHYIWRNTLKEDISSSSLSVSLSWCAGKRNKYIFIESVIEWEDSK